MKVINFAVNNFRAINGGLKQNTINFDDSNTIFIFGQNNVGKSTFLYAYDFFYSDKVASMEDFHRGTTENDIEFEVEFGIDEEDLRYIEEKLERKVDSFKTYLSSSSTIRLRKIFTKTTDTKGKIKIDNKNFTLNPSTNVWEETSFASLGLSSVFQRLAPKPIFIKAMPTEVEVEEIVNNILSSIAKEKLGNAELEELTHAQEKVKELQDKMYNPTVINNYKNEVNTHFQKLFPDTKIEIVDLDKVKWTEDKFGKKFNIEFQKCNEDGTCDDSTPKSYASIGHGAIRSAIFSLLLMRDIAEELVRVGQRKEYLILFEEPELFLYPRLLKILRELIYNVSENNYPYQILCASHSPQMIDLKKRKSTLVRMASTQLGTKLFQMSDSDLIEAKGITEKDKLKQEMYEVLRFNPYICESFYADEVILVEGPTEEIIIRGILQELNPEKDIFIANCGSVTNIPFYQRVYRKFCIKNHVICDTDAQAQAGIDEFANPIFTGGIQATIYAEHRLNCENDPRIGGLFSVHENTFEPAHKKVSIPSALRLPDEYLFSDGKPYNANRYWTEVLLPNINSEEVELVPIFKTVKDIIDFTWN